MTEIRGGNAGATQKRPVQRMGNAHRRWGATPGRRRATGGDTLLYYYVVYGDAAAYCGAHVVAFKTIVRIPHSTFTGRHTLTVVRGSYPRGAGWGERGAPAFHSHRKF